MLHELLQSIAILKPNSDVYGVSYPNGSGELYLNNEKRIIWENLDELKHLTEYWVTKAKNDSESK